MAVGESLDQFVLTMMPATEAVHWPLAGKSLDQVIAEAAKAAIETDLSAAELAWEIGVSRRDRFPPGDLIECDGILCFFPRELRQILNGRSLVVVDNRLRIQPDPGAPSAWARGP